MGLKHETLKFSFVTFLAILFGFIFHILLGRTFGISWQLDSFFVSLTFFGLLSGANYLFIHLFTPIFNEIKQKDPKESIIFIDIVLKWVLFMAVIIVLVSIIFNEAIVKFLAPGFDMKRAAITQEMNSILLFALIFFAASNVGIFALNAVYSYTIPGLASLFDPLLNISALFLIVPRLGIKGIAISYLLSNILKAFFILAYLYKKVGWRPTRYFYHHRLPELIYKSSQVGLSAFIWSLREVLARNIASRMGEGAVAIYSYAEKITSTIIQVVNNSIAKVFFSRVSEWLALARWDHIRDLFIRAQRINIFFSFSIVAILLSFLTPFLSILFLDSKFTSGNIREISVILNVLLIYFVVSTFEIYFSRLIYAMKKIKVIVANSIFGIIVFIVAAALLSRKIGVYGLAAAMAFSQIVTCMFYYLAIRKNLHINLINIILYVRRSFFISTSLAFLGIWANSIVKNVRIELLIVLPIWLCLYFILVRIFLKKEMHILFD